MLSVLVGFGGNVICRRVRLCIDRSLCQVWLGEWVCLVSVRSVGGLVQGMFHITPSCCECKSGFVQVLDEAVGEETHDCGWDLQRC